MRADEAEENETAPGQRASRFGSWGGNWKFFQSPRSSSQTFEDRSKRKGRYSYTHDDWDETRPFIYMVIPPDGGHAWIIVLCSFICQAVANGFVLSIGPLLPSIANDLGVTHDEVLYVASIQLGLFYAVAGFAAAFINTYGFRAVGITGCILSICAMFIASYSVNIYMLIVFYSVMAGIALGFIHFTAILILACYFDKHRPIASCIANSGGGFTVFILGLLNPWLLENYDWRFIFRLNACFHFLTLILVCFFVDVKPTKIGVFKEHVIADTDSESSEFFTYTKRYSTANRTSNREEKLLHLNLIASPRPRSSGQHTTEAGSIAYLVQQDPLQRQDLFHIGPEVQKEHREQRDGYFYAHENFSLLSNVSSSAVIHRLEMLDENYHTEVIAETAINSQDPIVRNSIRSLRKSVVHHAEPESSTCLNYQFQRDLRKLFNLKLLNAYEFRILFLAALLYTTGFNITFLYSLPHSGLSPEIKTYAAATGGFATMNFRIMAGFIIYNFPSEASYICGGGLVFGGIFVLTNSYFGVGIVWFQFIKILGIAAATTCFSTMRSVLYANCLGLENLTTAMALSSMAMGLGVLVGTLMAHVLNDATDSYSATFALSGICLIASGSLKIIVASYQT